MLVSASVSCWVGLYGAMYTASNPWHPCHSTSLVQPLHSTPSHPMTACATSHQNLIFRPSASSRARRPHQCRPLRHRRSHSHPSLHPRRWAQWSRPCLQLVRRPSLQPHGRRLMTRARLVPTRVSATPRSHPSLTAHRAKTGATSTWTSAVTSQSSVTCLHTCLYTCPCTYVSACLYTCLSTCLYTCLRTCLMPVGDLERRQWPSSMITESMHMSMNMSIHTCLHTCRNTYAYTHVCA